MQNPSNQTNPTSGEFATNAFYDTLETCDSTILGDSVIVYRKFQLPANTVETVYSAMYILDPAPLSTQSGTSPFDSVFDISAP